MYLKIIAAGHLGQKPELRYTPSGKAVANLSLACNRSWKDGDGNKQTDVTWLRVTLWGRMAEVAVEWLDKGRPVLVDGYLNSNEYGNPRIWHTTEGDARASFEMTARELRFLGSNGNGDTREPVAQTEEAPSDLGDQEEIPF